MMLCGIIIWHTSLCIRGFRSSCFTSNRKIENQTPSRITMLSSFKMKTINRIYFPVCFPSPSNVTCSHYSLSSLLQCVLSLALKAVASDNRSADTQPSKRRSETISPYSTS